MEIKAFDDLGKGNQLGWFCLVAMAVRWILGTVAEKPPIRLQGSAECFSVLWVFDSRSLPEEWVGNLNFQSVLLLFAAHLWREFPNWSENESGDFLELKMSSIFQSIFPLPIVQGSHTFFVSAPGLFRPTSAHVSWHCCGKCAVLSLWLPEAWLLLEKEWKLLRVAGSAPSRCWPAESTISYGGTLLQGAFPALSFSHFFPYLKHVEFLRLVKNCRGHGWCGGVFVGGGFFCNAYEAYQRHLELL